MSANIPTTRDVLLDVIRFHGDLASHYETLRDTVEEADSQVLLEYLYRHERNLQNAAAEPSCATKYWKHPWSFRANYLQRENCHCWPMKTSPPWLNWASKWIAR